ncbi:MAG: J domain-containing protein [Bdellovibrionales bacterium]
MFDKSYWQAAEKFVADDASPAPHVCEAPGCAQSGDFRAPKSPDDLRNYRWFCLQHVQEYNKAWNYFKDVGPEQMERIRREDVVGWRPTWPLGFLRPHQEMDAAALKRHIFERFHGDGRPRNNNRRGAAKATPVTLSGEEQSALKRLGLGWPVSLYEVKQRYRTLVKQHHPDTVSDVQEKKAADEVIKLINRAYAVIKKKLKG